jgi:hypothetical protein
MKRPFLLLSLLLAGCSTAPVADLMDYFSPGRMGPEATPPYGGVAAPHPGGSSLPPGTAIAGPGLPPVPPMAPAGGAALTGPVAPPSPSSFGPLPAPPAPY